MIKVEYDNGTEEEYSSLRYARHSILEAHAAGIGVDHISDTDEGICYTLNWDITFQRTECH